MNALAFTFCDTPLVAFPSGALHDPAQSLLCVSDLHFGKSDRIARRSGVMLPPYETRATLEKLEADIASTDARLIICLGDSFDDLAAAEALDDDCRLWLTRLQAGRRWIWIEGNHDPGPVTLGGSHHAQYAAGALTFRHIASEDGQAEISGHYHPKLALKGAGARPCFLFNRQRLIMPAYGTYTGGLHAHAPVIYTLMPPPAYAILTGRRAVMAPLVRP